MCGEGLERNFIERNIENNKNIGRRSLQVLDSLKADGSNNNYIKLWEVMDDRLEFTCIR